MWFLLYLDFWEFNVGILPWQIFNLTHLCEEVGAVCAVPEGVKEQDVQRGQAPQPVQRLAVEGDAGLRHLGDLERWLRIRIPLLGDSS